MDRRGSVELLAPRARAKGLDLRALAPRFAHGAAWRSRRLRQVLLNLVGNAIKFTEKGEVEVGGSDAVDGDSPRCASTCATPASASRKDRQAAVFESFTQADGSMTRRFGGTGLGPTISRQFVQMMGGRLEGRVSPGKGTTFSFSVTRSAGAGERARGRTLPISAGAHPRARRRHELRGPHRAVVHNGTRASCA